MNIRLLALMGTLLCSNPIWSFSCYFTLAKDDCWTNFNLTVDVIDTSKSQKLFTIKVPSGTTWARQEFTCSTDQTLSYVARFSPVFWKSDLEKSFTGIKNLSLPDSIKTKEVAWTIPVCFTSDFSEVPLPPNATGNCTCDFKNIPDPNE